MSYIQRLNRIKLYQKLLKLYDNMIRSDINYIVTLKRNVYKFRQAAELLRYMIKGSERNYIIDVCWPGNYVRPIRANIIIAVQKQKFGLL